MSGRRCALVLLSLLPLWRRASQAHQRRGEMAQMDRYAAQDHLEAALAALPAQPTVASVGS